MSRVKRAFQVPSRRGQALTVSARPGVASVARPGTAWLGSGLPGRVGRSSAGWAEQPISDGSFSAPMENIAQPIQARVRPGSSRLGLVGPARAGPARLGLARPYAEPIRRGSGVATYM